MGNEDSQPLNPNRSELGSQGNVSSAASTPNSDAMSIASEISRASTRRGRLSSASSARGSPTILPSPTKPPELDLSHLTDDERKQIADVLARAKELDSNEEVRTRELAKDLNDYANAVDHNRRSSLPHVSPKTQLCPICHQTQLNENDDGTREGQNVCMDCERFVCLNCGEFDSSLSTKIKMFICTMCQKRRQLVLSTGLWYHGERATLSTSHENLEKAMSVTKPVRRGALERASSLSRYENYKEYEKKMVDSLDRQESPHGQDDTAVTDCYRNEVGALISLQSPTETSPDGTLKGAKKKFRPQTLTLQDSNDKIDHGGGGLVSQMRRTFELHDIHAHDANYQRHSRYSDHDHYRVGHVLDRHLKTVHQECNQNSGFSPPRSPKVTRYRESPPRSPKFIDPHSGYVFSPPRSPKDSHFPTTYTDKSPPSRPPSREDLYGDSRSPGDNSKPHSPEDFHEQRPAMSFADDGTVYSRVSMATDMSYVDSVDLASYAKAIASNTEHLTNLSASPTRAVDKKSITRTCDTSVDRDDFFDDDLEEVELPHPEDKSIDYQGTDRQQVKPPINDSWSPITDLSPIIDVSPTLEMEAEADMRKHQEQMLQAQRSIEKQLCEGLSKLDIEQRIVPSADDDDDDSPSRLKRYNKITDINKIDQADNDTQNAPRSLIDEQSVIGRANNISSGNQRKREEPVKKVDNEQKSIKNESEQSRLSKRPDVPPKPKVLSGKSSAFKRPTDSVQMPDKNAALHQAALQNLPQSNNVATRQGSKKPSAQVKESAKPNVPPKPGNKQISGNGNTAQRNQLPTYANGKATQAGSSQKPPVGPPSRNKKPPAPQPPTNGNRPQPDTRSTSPPKVAPKPNVKPPVKSRRPTPAPRGNVPKPATRQSTASVVHETQPASDRKSLRTSADNVSGQNSPQRAPDSASGVGEGASRNNRGKVRSSSEEHQNNVSRPVAKPDRRDQNAPDCVRQSDKQVIMDRRSPKTDATQTRRVTKTTEPGGKQSPQPLRDSRQSPRTTTNLSQEDAQKSPSIVREHKVVDARISRRLNGFEEYQGRGREGDVNRAIKPERERPYWAKDARRSGGFEESSNTRPNSDCSPTPNIYDYDVNQSSIDSKKNGKNIANDVMEASASSISETDEEIVEIKLDDHSQPHIRRIPVTENKTVSPKRRVQTVNIRGLQVPVKISEQNRKLQEELRSVTHSRRRQLDELDEIRHLEKQLEGIRQLESKQREVMKKRMEIAKELNSIEHKGYAINQTKTVSQPIDISPPQNQSKSHRREFREMSPLSRGEQLSPLRSPQASPRRSRLSPKPNTDLRFSPIREDKDIEAEIQAKLDELERMECDNRVQSMPLYTSDYRLGFGRGVEERLSRSTLSPTSSPRTAFKEPKYSPKKMLSTSPGSNIQQIDFTFHPKLSRSSEFLTTGRPPVRGSRLSSSFSDVSIARRTPMRTYSLNAHDEGRLREQRKMQLQLEIDKRKRQIENNARLREELVYAMGSSDINPEYLNEVKARYQEHISRSRDNVDSSSEKSGIIRPLDDREVLSEKGLDSLSRDMVFWRRSGGGLYDQDNYSSSEYIAHRSDRGSFSDITDDFCLMSPREQYMRSLSAGGHPYSFCESKDSGIPNSTLLSERHAHHRDFDLPAPFEGFSDYSPIMTDNESSPHGDQRPHSMINPVLRRPQAEQRSRPISEDYDQMLQFQGDMAGGSSDNSFGDPDERIMDRMTEGGVTILHSSQTRKPSTPSQPMKYQFPTKRILLTQDPKDKKGNGIGMKIIGGNYVPGTNQEIGAYVAAIYPGGVVDRLNGEVQEGDQILEWNGLNLTGKSYEQVQKIIDQKCGEVELVIRMGTYMGSQCSTTSSASTPLAVTDPTASMRSSYDNLDTSVSDYDDCDRVLESMGIQSRFDPNKLANQLQGIQNNHFSSNANAFHADMAKLSPQKAHSNSPSPSIEKKIDFEEYINRKPTQNFGEIELQLSYDTYDHTLNVHVLQASNLIPKDSNGLSDPFVKVCILPPKQNDSKHRTKHIDKTLSPVWHQTLIFMNVPRKHLRRRIIQVSVWDYDRFSRDDFMGELLLPLDERTLDNKPRWYKLCDKSFIEDKLGIAPEIGDSSDAGRKSRGRSPTGRRDLLSPGSDGGRKSKSKSRDSSSSREKSRERSSSRERVAIATNGTTEAVPVKKPVKTMFRWMLYNVADEHL